MGNSFILECVGIFLCVAALDYAWGKYVLAMHNVTAISAANWSVFLSVMSGFMSIAFVHDPWLLLPGGFGAWIGTYLSKTSVTASFNNLYDMLWGKI